MSAAHPAGAVESQRAMFYRLVPELLAEHERAVLVLAEIGASYLDHEALAPVAERVVNVGIREQLMIGVAGGLALAGMRPIAHTFPPFLIERPFEQVKLDLGHQGVGAVLVSSGGSYDWPQGGQSHFGHRDVALIDTLSGWTVHTPGHPAEAEALLRAAMTGNDRVYLRLDDHGNARAHQVATASMSVLRRGGAGTVIAVGPVADRVLTAIAELDVTILYAATIRPFDAATLRATLGQAAVVLVEPYLAGTSSHAVSAALSQVPHRLLALGVSRQEHRHYGTIDQHDRLHGLDVAGLRASITAFLTPHGGTASAPRPTPATLGAPSPAPTGARQHAHILTTVLAALAQHGYPRLSIEGLATQAGVNKATLYRWWSGKPALVAEALTQHTDTGPLPDTGATRADLLAWLATTAAGYANIHAEVTVPALIGDLAATDGAAEAFRETFLGRQRAGCAELVRRGIARGDLPATTDVELILDVITATVLHRHLLSGTPTTGNLPQRILDLLLGPDHDTPHPPATA